MADLYLRNPQTGEVEVFDEADAQAAANAGYAEVTPEQYEQARRSEARTLGPERAAAAGLVTAPDDYDATSAFAEKVYSGLTFGQGEGIATPEAVARGQRFQTEHPGLAFAGEFAGQLPYTAIGGAAGQAVRGAVAGAGWLARGAVAGADILAGAAVGGAQIEGEQARLAAENFSFTDAALAGVSTEVLGRSAAWGIAKGVGGARNLMARAEREAVAGDAARSLERGGWVNDYRVAAHAEAYHDELADLAAKDLDTLESAFGEVSRQDLKRARIQKSVVDNPAVQHAINVQAIEDLKALRGALTSELAEAGTGPAKRLAKHLDDRLAELEAAPKGKKLWRSLDENRQALQEYRQDLYQAYDSNPGSAWLSRDGLAAIDRAEEATRNALLREDAWGEAAARMQREYNTPFHEKWFPARQTVLKDLHFSTGKDARGFPIFRGEPGKVRKFLTSLTGTSPDVHRVREMFTSYLDGAVAVAKAGERDAPAAARQVAEAARRLRKALANAQAVSGAAERTAKRTGLVDAGAGVAAAVGGAAAFGPAGLVAGPVTRGFHLAEWLGRASRRLGVGSGDQLSMAKLLDEGALPPVTEGARVAERLADDVLDGTPGPFRPSGVPPAPGGPIAPSPVRGVGAAEAARRDTYAGVGQARRAAADRPAGAEALQPLPRPRDVGTAEPLRHADEAPTILPGARTRTAAPEGEAPIAGGPSRLTAPDAGSYAPPLSEVYDEVTDPTARATTPSPFRQEKFAGAERMLAPGADARAREASRLQALTEGEFADVVSGLRASGDPEAKSLADALWAKKDVLLGAGLVVGGTYAAEAEADAGFAGAGVGAAALLLGRRAPGDWLAKAPRHVGAAVEGLERMGFDVGPGHVKILEKTFGAAQPTPEQLAKMVPLDVLEELAPRGAKPRVYAVSGALAWEAEGVSTTHPEWGFEAPTWKIGRTFERGPSGELVVHHDYFYIRDDLQSGGIGARVLKSQMEAYRDLGVNQVEVSCDEVGKYFWPSIGFDHPDPKVVQSAVNAYQNWVVQKKLALPSAVAAEARTIRSLPRLAQAEFGKEFLLAKKGEWNMHLELKLDDADPRYHLMKLRLGLDDITPAASRGQGGELAAGAALGGLALVGQLEGEADPNAPAEDATAGAAAPLAGLALFGRRATALKGARQRLVADVAKRLFTATAAPTARVVTRLAYSRSELAKRQQEFQAFRDNPQSLVDRVAEGFREVPPEQSADVNAGVFKTAAFLQTKLPQARKSPVALRETPVSAEHLIKYARYEQAALARDFEACTRLSAAFDDNIIAPIDTAKAYAWTLVAVQLATKSEDAEKLKAKLKEQSDRLPPADLTSAQNLARAILIRMPTEKEDAERALLTAR